MRWFALIVLLGLFSCKGTIDRASKPDDLIPRDTMVSILTEMVKLESFVQAKYVQPAKYHEVMIHSGDSLLKVFNVSKSQYERSFKYYASYQEEMIGMYEESLDRLNRELGELQSTD